MGVKYTCSACGETHESEWTEEEALAESKLLWGDLQPDDRAVICDDCYHRGLPTVLAKHYEDNDIKRN